MGSAFLQLWGWCDLPHHSPRQTAASLASCPLQMGPDTCGETHSPSFPPCSIPLPSGRMASTWSWPRGPSQQNGRERTDRVMDKARNPTAHQQQRFPGLQRVRNSHAGGCKPLIQQVCARLLCSFGQAGVVLLPALPLRSGATSRCAPCQSHRWDTSHPVVCRGDQGRYVSGSCLVASGWGTEGTASML